MSSFYIHGNFNRTIIFKSIYVDKRSFRGGSFRSVVSKRMTVIRKNMKELNAEVFENLAFKF